MDKLLKIVLVFVNAETIRYIIIGLINTALNFIIFWLLSNAIGIHYLIANATALIISMIFVFVTNKYFVFKSNVGGINKTVTESVMFILFSGLSASIDMFLMYTLVDLILVNNMVARLIVNIIMTIVNYIIRKFIVFRSTINIINEGDKTVA